LGQEKELDENVITSSKGEILAIWKNNKLQFAKNLNIDQKQFTSYIANYFTGRKESKS
jgi:hypothetical protein